MAYLPDWSAAVSTPPNQPRRTDRLIHHHYPHHNPPQYRLLNYLAKKDRSNAIGLAAELGIRFRAPDEARSKFEMYRFFKNTKSKKAKNMQLVGGQKEGN